MRQGLANKKYQSKQRQAYTGQIFRPVLTYGRETWIQSSCEKSNGNKVSQRVKGIAMKDTIRDERVQEQLKLEQKFIKQR